MLSKKIYKNLKNTSKRYYLCIQQRNTKGRGKRGIKTLRAKKPYLEYNSPQLKGVFLCLLKFC